MAGTPQSTREQDAPPGTTGSQEEVARPPRRRPGPRLAPQERAELVQRLATRYTDGASIRQIAGEEELSYGFVHRLLTESGTGLRGRGGSTRRAAS
ncbi:helix-turn-helix domain-containing protein [Pseudokineococcus basanitobsidens]|uniref:Helix-turn-helix domain-containing protein n=1 Tax=Pseudokineococcus basanitobsidens TaxID=1926649 RepID=A0ABU8RLZ3_9ACTN